MSDPEATIRREHRHTYAPERERDECRECGESWPCQTIQLADELVRERSRSEDAEREWAVASNEWSDYVDQLLARAEDEQRKREQCEEQRTEERSRRRELEEADEAALIYSGAKVKDVNERHANPGHCRRWLPDRRRQCAQLVIPPTRYCRWHAQDVGRASQWK